MLSPLLKLAVDDPTNITLVAQAMLDRNFDWLEFDDKLFVLNESLRETAKVSLNHVMQHESCMAVPLVLSTLSQQDSVIAFPPLGKKALLRLSRALGIPLSSGSYHLAESVQKYPITELNSDNTTLLLSIEGQTTQFTDLVLKLKTSIPGSLDIPQLPSLLGSMLIETIVVAELPPAIHYGLETDAPHPLLQAAWHAHNLKLLQMVRRYVQKQIIEPECTLGIVKRRLTLGVRAPFRCSTDFSFSWLPLEEKLKDQVEACLAKCDMTVIAHPGL